MRIFYALIEGKPDLMVYYFMYIYMMIVIQSIPIIGRYDSVIHISKLYVIL